MDGGIELLRASVGRGRWPALQKVTDPELTAAGKHEEEEKLGGAAAAPGGGGAENNRAHA